MNFERITLRRAGTGDARALDTLAELDWGYINGLPVFGLPITGTPPIGAHA